MFRVFGMTICSAALLFLMESPANAQSAMTHHVRQAVVNGQAKFVSPMPATQSLRLDVVLPLRDQAKLDKLVQEIYDPASPSYRHFLTVSEFTERFGPSQADYEALTRYAEANGFQVVGGSRDGMDLQIEGTVGSVEAAFHVSMGVYQHPTENRTFYAPDHEPTVGLPFALWQVSGLDNYSTPRPMLAKKSDDAKGRGREPSTVESLATTGSGPSASYLGSDMRAAYYGGTALTGAGQNLGLLEFSGTDLADLNTYLANVHQTNTVPITLFSTDGTSTSCLYSQTSDCDDTEPTIDLTQVLGMAPGLSSVVVYIGVSETSVLSAMTTHSPLATTIACSWTWSPADPTSDNPYFEKMAAQGQNFFVAAGDHSTWSTSNIDWPADSPYVVSVGGTTLVTASAGGAWASETAWANGGGGISPDSQAIPAWQQLAGVINSSNKGSTTLRNGPDVAANAAYSYYVCADQIACTDNKYGGTSFAAPLWAGYMALVNQQAAANGKATLGFINPTIYSYGVGSSYNTYFHDITSGTSGSYSAVTGFDLVTGWGSPAGAALIAALSGTPTPPNFTISVSPTSATVAQGANGTSTITTTVSGGFSSAVALTASGQPTGVTVSFSPTSIASPGSGTSTMTMAVASTTAAGVYTITVTGTGSGTTHTATVSLAVTAPAFTISASPTSVTTAQGSSGKSTITTAVSGGFSSAVALTASGQPTGVTVSFSPASIASPGSGTSAMTMAVASTAAAGTYTITVTGTGSGITHTATVSLTVTAPAFTISASPTSVSAAQGSSGKSTITTAVSGGFSSAIALTASGQPTGVTVSFSPTSVASPGSGNSTMTMAVASTAAAGTYTITVTGTGGGITHTATVSLTVTAPAFTISASPTSVSAAQGSSGKSTITTAVSGGFSSAIALTASGQPTGVTVSFSPTSIASPGSGTSTMTMAVASTAAAGTYTITVTGTGGGITHTATVSLTVTAPAFTISASPTSDSVAQGNSGKSTITTAVSGGFSSAIALTASGQPTGVTVSFSPTSIASPGSGTSTMTMAVASTAAAGSYTITVTGTGGGITHTATVSLTVTSSTAALTLTFPTGSSANGTVGVAYSASLTAAGGKAPYTYSISTGKLPAGLTLNSTTGAITGTPTTAVSGTAANMTAKVVDSNGTSATASGAITIAASSKSGTTGTK